MRTLTTGLAGQQQPRSARRGGPCQPAGPSAAPLAALALRRGNLILVHQRQAAGVNALSRPLQLMVSGISTPVFLLAYAFDPTSCGPQVHRPNGMKGIPHTEEAKVPLPGRLPGRVARP